MDFFHVVPEEEALRLIEEVADSHCIDVEEVGLEEACGRTLAQEVTAAMDVPAFNRSTVDGFAVISGDSHGASTAIPAMVDKIGSVEMGQLAGKGIQALQTMYVPTGGMLPDGADAVVMIEDTEMLDEETVAVYKAVTSGDNVIHRGDDIKAGATILDKGRHLTPVDIGVLAAMGINTVRVLRQVRVSILSTGDEIIPVGDKADLGQIYDINGNVLVQMCRVLGVEVVAHKIIKDDFDDLYKAVKEGTDRSDLVILSGGSSVGTRDYTYEVIEKLKDSRMLLKGVAVKPGKPTILGTGNGSIIFGLPGHPVSSIMIFRIFVQHLLERLMGIEGVPRTFEGVLTESVHGAPGRTTYQMVKVERTGSDLRIKPVYGRSGMITLLSESDGYIRIPAEKEGLEAGAAITGYYM